MITLCLFGRGGQGIKSAAHIVDTAAFLGGGLIGSKLGAFKFNHDKLRLIVGAIVAVAGITIMLKTMI